MKWLEQAYIVRTNDGLKMKFMFSDNISTITTPGKSQ